MGTSVAIILAALLLIALVAVVLFILGLIGSRRGITGGPLVATARVLFVAFLILVAVALVATIWGALTSWA